MKLDFNLTFSYTFFFSFSLWPCHFKFQAKELESTLKHDREKGNELSKFQKNSDIYCFIFY